MAAIAKSYSELKNTTVVIMPPFPAADSTDDVSNDSLSDGVKCFHCYYFTTTEGEVLCREESASGVQVVQSVD